MTPLDPTPWAQRPSLLEESPLPSLDLLEANSLVSHRSTGEGRGHRAKDPWEQGVLQIPSGPGQL